MLSTVGVPLLFYFGEAGWGGACGGGGAPFFPFWHPGLLPIRGLFLCKLPLSGDTVGAPHSASSPVRAFFHLSMLDQHNLCLNIH